MLKPISEFCDSCVIIGDTFSLWVVRSDTDRWGLCVPEEESVLIVGKVGDAMKDSSLHSVAKKYGLQNINFLVEGAFPNGASSLPQEPP